MKNPSGSQRPERAQSHPLQAQLAPQSHTETQAQVLAQEQGDVQTQLPVFMLAVFASFVVVFMTYLVFGLPRSYPDCTSES